MDQNRLQAELDFIQGQQQELEQLIEPLETAAASTTPAQHQGDRQRENMHLVAQVSDTTVPLPLCLFVNATCIYFCNSIYFCNEI